MNTVSSKSLCKYLQVRDMAEIALFVLGLSKEQYQSNTHAMLSHLNVGSGTEVSIADLAKMIARVVGYKGRIVYDSTKPDGTARKLMDSTRLNALGWRPRIDLEEGIANTYQSWAQ